MVVSGFKRQPQQIAQPQEKLIGKLHIFLHQNRDCIQRVEEKMRLQLYPQRIELCTRELRLELRRTNFAFSILAVVIDCVAQPDNHPIRDYLGMESCDVLVTEFGRQRAARRLKSDPTGDQHVDRQESKRESATE